MAIAVAVFYVVIVDVLPSLNIIRFSDFSFSRM